jgi:hypothetical protein
MKKLLPEGTQRKAPEIFLDPLGGFCIFYFD